MKAVIPLVFALAAAAAQASGGARTQVLETPRYTVSIETRCPEGEVTCDRVRYRGVNKRNGQAIVLQGRTAHTRCADGTSPCRFLGWEFSNGRVSYFVGESGELVVRRGEQVLLQETGTWR